MKKTFKGYITRTLFKSPDNDFKIFLVETEDGLEVRINGHLPDLSTDFLYEFTGDQSVHPKYGLQYKITHFKKSENQSTIGLIHYLSSDLFTGIGPVRAARIVNHLGDQAINKILENKDVLKEIGFNAVQTERLYQQLFHNQNLEETLVSLLGYGLTSNLAMKLYTKYGYQTLQKVHDNPYDLIKDMIGIGFKRADDISSKLGIEKDDPRRIEAAIIYVLEQYINNNGDTYIIENDFFKVINQELLKDVNQDVIIEKINFLIENKQIVKDDNKYTLYTILQTEKNIAKEINRFLTKTSLEDKYDTYIEEVEKRYNITYTNQQKKAIAEAMNSQFTIITGGPGTGKTTVLFGFLEVYARANGLDLHNQTIIEKIGLAAPTGRAARRMKEVMDVDSFTIHKLLGFDHTGHFFHNEKNRLFQDLIIIDEASMIDIYLAEQLFKSISSSTKVIIVGDKDQLPSVGPGQVLADLIDSNKVPVIYLDEIHRQSENSSIIKLANQINKQFITNDFDSSEDLFFINLDQGEIIKLMLGLVKKALESGYDLVEDIQILIPLYRGPVGIDAVNEIFQNSFLKEGTPYMNYGTLRFYEGDKVIHQVNNPVKGVMNGDIGQIKKIYETADNKKVMVVNYLDNDVHYEQNELEELKLAYAISVHKSQGSEYKIVLMPLVRGYSIMLRKELLYTGVTRAKNYLYLIGDLSLIEIASKRLNKKRKTNLLLYLKEIEEEIIEEEVSPFDFM